MTKLEEVKKILEDIGSVYSCYLVPLPDDTDDYLNSRAQEIDRLYSQPSKCWQETESYKHVIEQVKREMTEITQERIKEFWEKCGLNLRHEYESCGVVGVQTCRKCGALKPAISKSCCMPVIDLNNLFKYAVPRVHGVKLQTFERPDTGFYTYEASVFISPTSLPVVSYGDNPVIALFLSVEEALKCSNQ
jgi:hypothetical protein